MGSYPKQRVDVTPTPRFGPASSALPGTAGQGNQPSTPADGNAGAQEVPIARGARPWRPSRRILMPPEGAGRRPDAAALAADRQHIRFAITLTVGVLVLIWGVFLIDAQFNLGLKRFGNRPLTTRGLPGILTMAFLHGDLKHIWGNTVSFFSLSGMLLYFYRGVGLQVLLLSWVGSGVLLWMSGASGNHIGLSGVIYALAAFLFVSGIIRGISTLMRVALVVVFLYGSIVWGVLPIEQGVSWQGHLAGACTGAMLAVTLRHKGPRPAQPEMDEDESVDGRVSTSAHAVTQQHGAAEPSAIHAEATLRARRSALLWKGSRPSTYPATPSQSRGIRKPRRGPHLKSRIY